MLSEQEFFITTTSTRYYMPVTIPAGTTEIALLATFSPSGTAGGDDSFYMEEVQFEQTAVAQVAAANPFEIVPYGYTLELCQRYLPAFNSNGTTSAIPGSGYFTSATSAVLYLPLPVMARVPPTGISVDAVTHFSLLPGSLTSSNVVINTSYTSQSVGALTVTVAGGTAQNPALIYFNNAAGQLLFTGCEL
jgi:hypothetical protein